MSEVTGAAPSYFGAAPRIKSNCQIGGANNEKTNVNVDFCGIRNLLLSLLEHGFSEKDIQKIMARIAATSGADIILFR